MSLIWNGKFKKICVIEINKQFKLDSVSFMLKCSKFFTEDMIWSLSVQFTLGSLLMCKCKHSQQHE